MTYGYDVNGQRTTVGGTYARTGLPAALASATYDDANQIATFDGTSFTYDPNGNLTSDGLTSYSWNARNQLVGMSGGTSASFAYDAFERRRSKTIGGTATNFLYDGMNFVQELTTGGTPTANLLTGLRIDETFTRTDVTGTSTLLVDALGSTLELADASGMLQTHHTFEPFGTTTTSGASSTNSAQFTGRENDGTGLYFNRARFYSPKLQRFVSEDPLGVAGGMNLFAYAQDAPTVYADPLGLKPSPGFGQPPGSGPGGPVGPGAGDPGGPNGPANNSTPQTPQKTPCAAPSGKHLSMGVAVQVATVNPFTSGGGGVWGGNQQSFGATTYNYTYSGTGAGLDVGASVQSVWAYGSGSWTGPFHSISISAGPFSGSIFWTSGKGGWTGASFGLAAGSPGAAYEVTNYTCRSGPG